VHSISGSNVASPRVPGPRAPRIGTPCTHQHFVAPVCSGLPGPGIAAASGWYVSRGTHTLLNPNHAAAVREYRRREVSKGQDDGHLGQLGEQTVRHSLHIK